MRTRISAADRLWLPYATVRLFGPVEVPTADQLMDALDRFVAQRPRHPMACTIDAAAGRWRPVPAAQRGAHVARMLHVLPAGTAPALAGGFDSVPLGHSVVPLGHSVLTGGIAQAADELLRTDTGELPLRLVVGGQYFGFVMAHALGDAASANLIVEAALGCAHDPDALLRVPPPRTSRALVRLLARQVVRRPGSLLRIARDRSRDLDPEPPLAGPVPAPACAVIAGRTTNAVLPALRTWRDAHAPGLSVATLMCWVARKALGEAGAAVRDDGLIMLVDLRRYGSGRRDLAGNLALGVAVHAPQQAGPTAVQTAVGELLGSARPVTGALVGVVNEARRRRPGSGAESGGPLAPPPGRATVLVTYLGRAATMRGVRWRGSAVERELVVGTTPGSVGDITLVMTEIDDVLHLSIIFHESRHPRWMMQRSLELLTNPVQLLDGAAQSGVTEPSSDPADGSDRIVATTGGGVGVIRP
ncbi:putative Condensation domain-containing protein [Frankia sp. AiPs1]|uniref:hypothetical protein n=1 Tax=Frankia sp. AiPa1 TaxID=573492 RepID=UPI00202B1843|nr:hypothetical protein [Frankia sp. AiPa1]MCL9758324.1 hypothetical protein [Frankia sp. AiPa1]